MIYDNVIMRTIIDLPPRQVAALSRFCKSLGISRAEAIRKALAQFLEGKEEGREKAFGAWKKSRLNATEFVRGIREEWEP